MNLYEFKVKKLSFIVASKTEDSARSLILNDHLSKVAKNGGDMNHRILVEGFDEKESILAIFNG